MNSLYRKIDSAKVSKAIEDFENEVDFEFIPVIAEKSSYVDHISWIISLMLLILFIGGIDYFFQDSYASKVPYYFVAPFLAVILGVLLDKSDLIDRFFISKQEQTRQAQEKAERIFFKKKLHESKSQNALLLYVSVMERKIVLFPDPRHQIKNMPELTQEVLSRLQKSFKKKEFEAGIIDSIHYLKENLIKTHKKTSNAENQFSNTLIWWND